MFPTLKVELSDGRVFEVTVSLADMAAWERYAVAHGMTPPAEFTTNQSLFQVWRSARKQGICDQGTELEAFCDRIVNFEVLGGDEPPTPTGPAPGAG